MKKILSFILCSVMFFSMTSNVFASNSVGGPLYKEKQVISSIAGEYVYLYSGKTFNNLGKGDKYLLRVLNAMFGERLEESLEMATYYADEFEKGGIDTEKEVKSFFSGIPSAILNTTTYENCSPYGEIALQNVFKKGFRFYPKSLNIKIDNKTMAIGGSYGSAYVNYDDRTMVPLRLFAETAGYKVDWNNSNKEITIYKDDLFSGKSVKFRIGQKTYLTLNKGFGAKTLVMDTVPVIYSDRTYIPLRFAAEALGYKVDYNPDKACITCN